MIKRYLVILCAIILTSAHATPISFYSAYLCFNGYWQTQQECRNNGVVMVCSIKLKCAPLQDVLFSPPPLNVPFSPPKF